MHQGIFFIRSLESVIGEIRSLSSDKGFLETVSDLSDPTPNLFAARNGHSNSCLRCRCPSCL